MYKVLSWIFLVAGLFVYLMAVLEKVIYGFSFFKSTPPSLALFALLNVAVSGVFLLMSIESNKKK